MSLFSKTFNAKKVLPYLALLFLGFLIYSNVLNGEFVSDDHTYISINPAVRDAGDIRAIWASFNARFLPGLTFALNYQWGGLDVFGYHFVNILFHVLASFLVFRFILLTFQTPALKDTPLAQDSISVAFLSSLIFLCHPIQTQGVAFVTQRCVSMVTACYLLTIIFYVLARIRFKRRYYIAALGTSLVGLLCKENIITIPLTLCVYELFFFKGEGRKWVQRLRLVIPFFFMWLLLPLILMQDRPGSVLEMKDQVLFRSIDWNYFFTEINVLRTYLRLFILPVNQVHEYDYPLVRGLFELPTIYSVCLLTALLGLAYYLFLRKRAMSFCILWFFITTLPEFMVVSLSNRNLIYEHWLYLPMVGFAFFLSFAVHAFFKNKQRMRWAAVVLIILLASATYERNKVWQNEIRFWEDVIKKSPDKATPYFAIGIAYDHKGYEQQAIQAYYKTLEVDPDFAMALNNLGGIYLKKGEYAKAMAFFKKILDITTEFPKAYNNIAYINYLEGNYEEAIRYYRESMARQEPYADGHFYIGRCFLEVGHYVEARDNLQKALSLYQKRHELEKAKEAELLIKKIP